MAKNYTETPDRNALDTALIIHPEIANTPSNRCGARTTHEKIDEISSLSRAIHLRVIGVEEARVSRIQSGSFLGKGTRERIGRVIEECEPNIVIFNQTLSPVQQRNLENEWNAKVIDRTGLILEIFGARAQTKEGVLQVELAALEYQKSRLVRSWTHLERQRGGAGFMGGPGERQIELDRRIISDKITKLKSSLEDVRRTRELGRINRQKVPFPVVALVGYTNAGKSTLFNNLTDSTVFAKDLLFATLDPTMRRLELPSGEKIILSDTVGFISDLPTHLIEAFRATLEQIVHADVILHIIDSSRPDYDTQRKDVITILEELGVNYNNDPRVIEAYNKSDLLSADQSSDLQRFLGFDQRTLLISAQNSQGVDDLLENIQATVGRNREEGAYLLSYADGKALSWLYSHAEVLGRDDQDDGIKLNVRIERSNVEKFKKHYNYSIL